MKALVDAERWRCRVKISRSPCMAGSPIPEPQSIELDEAFGIMMIISDGTFLEG